MNPQCALNSRTGLGYGKDCYCHPVYRASYLFLQVGGNGGWGRLKKLSKVVTISRTIFLLIQDRGRLNLSPDISVSGCENQIIGKIPSREKNFLRSVQVNLDFPPFCQGIFVKLYLCLNNTIPIRYKENKKTAPSSIQADDVFLANYENIKLGLPLAGHRCGCM